MICSKGNRDAEVIVPTAASSFGVVAWCRRPAKWINVVAGVGVSMSGFGVNAALLKIEGTSG